MGKRSANEISRRRFVAAFAVMSAGFFGRPGLSQGTAPSVASRSMLSRSDPSRHPFIFLCEPGREGLFGWHSGDLSEQVSRDRLQGVYVPGLDPSGRAGAWVREGRQLRPEMFGAGADDATPALQSMLDHLGAGYEGVITGRYTISRELALNDRHTFTLSGGGTIKALDGMPVAWGFGLIRLTRCSEFTIRDLNFDGNRHRRVAREVPAQSVIFDSCTDFTCERVRSDNAVVDGFIILSETPQDAATHCRNFRMIDCHADNCFRQGCSVIQGHAGTFVRGSYTRTNGTAPSAGIDLESDAGAPRHSIETIRFEEVRFEGNAGFGLLVSGVSHPRDIHVVDCRFVDNRLGAISWGSQTGVIDSAYIEGFGDAAFRGAIDVPSDVQCSGLTIRRPTFRRVSATLEDKRLIYVHSHSGGNVAIMGMDVDSCAGIASLWAPRCRLTDSSRIVSDRGTFHGAILVYGSDCEVSRNRITNFYGAVIYAEGPRFEANDNSLLEPRYNDSRGCIRVIGTGARVSRNVVRTTRSLSHGIVASGSVALSDNAVTGFAIPIG